jgi:flagellar biogenesis protein FliO
MLNVVLVLSLLTFNAAAAPPEGQDPDGRTSAPQLGPANTANSPGLAPEPEIPKSQPPDLVGEDLNLGWTLIRTVVVLAFVVIVAYLTLNVGLRRLLGIRPTSGTKMVSVLERVVLDQKRSLYVVKAAGEVLLLGAADNSLSLLSKLNPEGAAVAESAPPAPGALSPFMKKLLGSGAPPTSGKDGGIPS